MSEPKRPGGHWQRSSYCADGQCVEVLAAGDEVLIRNSADPAETVRFFAAEWTAFLDGVKRGEFDR